MPGKRWMDEELLKLHELIAAEHSRTEVAAALNRTVASVHLQARALGLRFSRRNTLRSTWTESEDNALRYHSGTLTRKQLAKKLGRTEAAVGKRAYQLGVQLGQGRMTLKALADELGVAKVTVVRVRDILGLNFRRYPSKATARTKPKGPEPEDIVAIAEYLVNHSTGPLRTSRKRLMDVIAAYSGQPSKEEAA